MTATSCSSRAGFPAIVCSPSCRSPSAPTPRRGPPGSFSRAPSGSPRSPIIPGPRGRSSATSASLRSSRSRSTTRCAGSASWTATRWRRSCPPSPRGAIGTSSSTRSAPTPMTDASCAASTPRAGGTTSSRSPTVCSPPSRATWRGRRSSTGVAGPGSTPFDRRTGEGVLRNLVVREGRRTGQIQVRFVTSPTKLDSEALASASSADAVLWSQIDSVAEVTQGGETQLLSGTDRLEEELGGHALSHLAARVLSDEHRDGRAAVRGRGRVRAAAAATSASTTCSAASGRSGC